MASNGRIPKKHFMSTNDFKPLECKSRASYSLEQRDTKRKVSEESK